MGQPHQGAGLSGYRDRSLGGDEADVVSFTVVSGLLGC